MGFDKSKSEGENKIPIRDRLEKIEDPFAIKGATKTTQVQELSKSPEPDPMRFFSDAESNKLELARAALDGLSQALRKQDVGLKQVHTSPKLANPTTTKHAAFDTRTNVEREADELEVEAKNLELERSIVELESQAI